MGDTKMKFYFDEQDEMPYELICIMFIIEEYVQNRDFLRPTQLMSPSWTDLSESTPG